MKKILFIHHGCGLGGASIALAEMLKPLRGKFSFRICCIFDSDAVEFFRSQGFDVFVLNGWFYQKFYKIFIHSVAATWSPRPFLYHYLLSFYLNRYFFAPKLLKQSDVDMVYLNTTFLPDWACVAKR